jgi:hypothetical protein
LRGVMWCWERWLEKCTQEYMDGLQLLSGSREAKGVNSKETFCWLCLWPLCYPRSGDGDFWVNILL